MQGPKGVYLILECPHSQPPVKATLVCFPCSASPSTMPTVTDTFLNSLWF